MNDIDMSRRAARTAEGAHPALGASALKVHIKVFISPSYSSASFSHLSFFQTENTVRSLLSILEQCAELPEEHFLSYAMFYNDVERSKTFKPSKDFAPVEEDLADEVLDTAGWFLVFMISLVIRNFHTFHLHLFGFLAGMAKIDLPRLTTGHHEVTSFGV